MTTLAGILAVAAAISAQAQESREPQSSFPEGVEPVELHAVDLLPMARPNLGRILSILNSNIDPRRGRDLHFGLSRQGATRFAASLAGVSEYTLPLATSSLTQVSSSIRVGVAGEVTAGRSIVLHIEGTGTANAEWSVCLLLPDPTAMKWDIEEYVGARQYDKREVQAGDSHGGFQAVSFPTYGPDAGRMLGVLIEQAEFPSTRHVFWVQVVQ